MKAEIISQPISGEFEEIIYEIQSPWNSSFWTWVKFRKENGDEIVGQFPGVPKSVKISHSQNEILVLTSNHLYRLDGDNFDLIETDIQTECKGIEVSPKGEFVLHTYYNIMKMEYSINELIDIKLPFKMDSIKFKSWHGNLLEFECESVYERVKKNMILDVDCLTIFMELDS